jgi:hypothetical protein
MGVFAWKASLVPDDGCRAASLGEPLVLSATTVSRGVVLLLGTLRVARRCRPASLK